MLAGVVRHRRPRLAAPPCRASRRRRSRSPERSVSGRGCAQHERLGAGIHVGELLDQVAAVAIRQAKVDHCDVDLSQHVSDRGTWRSANAYGRPSRWNIGKSSAISDSGRPNNRSAYLLLNKISPEGALATTTESGGGRRPFSIRGRPGFWALEEVTTALPTLRPTPFLQPHAARVGCTGWYQRRRFVLCAVGAGEVSDGYL